MPMRNTAKTAEKYKPTEVFNIEYVCTVLKEHGTVKDSTVAEITRRAQTQYETLRKQYGKQSLTRITPVDVISSMKLMIPALEQDDANEKSNGDGNVLLTEERIMKTLAAHWKLPFLKIEMSKIKGMNISTKLSEPFARKHLIVPVLPSKTMLLVALVNPLDIEAMDTVRQATKLKIRPVISTKSDILRAIARCYARKKSQLITARNRDDFQSFIKAAARELPGNEISKEEYLLRISDTSQFGEKHIVNAVNSLLQYAFEQRASDIHIEPKQSYSVIRLRIDGFLHEFERIPHEVHNNFVVRLKALSGMQIAEKRKPLDGSFKANFHKKDVEFRISTMPVAFGEKVMVRVLEPSMLLQRIDDIGFSQRELDTYSSLIGRNHGMVLVTGPAGSGKTTTLYSTLKTLSEQAINITTIEEPIELVHEPFNQITVQPQAGLTFGTAIRHIVRQASDVIMVGEIRDRDTVENAFKAALTGHLVLSTLHTNDAPSTIVRLADMGAQTSLMETALLGVVSQRLARKVCEYCGEPYNLSQEERKGLLLSEEDIQGLSIRKGFGCEHCRGTGYLGRTAIFEIMRITDDIRGLIHKHTPAHLIRSAAIKDGMQTLRGSAMAKFKAGIIPADEVLRITGGKMVI